LDPTIRAITCPFCKNILFALGLDAKNGSAAWNMTKDSPAVQKDGAGQYMHCGKCSKRVAVEKISAPGVDSWKVAAAQQ
jgi:transcription elongation factor Elf1